MFEFLALVDDQQATAVFDSSSSVSYIASRWIQSLGLKHCSPQNAIVSVNTSSGPFSCSIHLFRHLGSNTPDAVLDRDWFNHCTSACQDGEILSVDGRRLVFNGLPSFLKLFAKHTNSHTSVEYTASHSY